MALNKKGRDDLREKALSAELIGTEWAQKLGCGQSAEEFVVRLCDFLTELRGGQ